MGRKLLFVASTSSHLIHFHIPYLQQLHKQGWEVHVACGAAPQQLPHVDRVISIPFEKKMTSPRNFRAIRLLRNLLLQEQYAAVLIHTSLAACFTRLAVMGLNQRPAIVNMVHGYLFDAETPALKRLILSAAERLTAPVTDLLLTMNRWDYEYAGKHRLGTRIAAVPGVGVDFSRLDAQRCGDAAALRQSLGIDPEAFVLIYPAEFSPRKSQAVLLQTMTRLPDRAVLVLPGNGQLLEPCRRLARKLGLENRAVFPGYVTEMGLWYEMSDAAVSASRSEGLPFNIMEAMHCGLPVVASEVKGHTDLIRSGNTGLLYPYGDSAACAAQIRRLTEDPALAKAIGQQGQTETEIYTLEAVLPQVMAQYNSILEP